MVKGISIAISLLLALLPASGITREDQPRPLLLPGKQTLYQRVLARPGAWLYSKPDVDNAKLHAVTPFTLFYVYQRHEGKGEDWILVGKDSHGNTVGWLPKAHSMVWNQGLTVAFGNPIGRDRTLLFRDDQTLKKLIQDRDLDRYAQMYAQAEAGQLPPDSPLVAIQPKAYIDIQDDFYLVPIHAYEDVYMGDEQARVLRVSSVPLREAGEGKATTPGSYRSGVVFVIDATTSMGPYIERTREAVRKIYDTIAEAGLLGHVSFGLIAYRDNTSVVSGLEYLTRTYATLEDGQDPAEFLRRVEAVAPAAVSSRDFVEDAYAGLKQALDAIDWSGHEARYIVLISDAGARRADDPLGSTGLSAGTLRRLAQDKGIAVSVLHLLTPSRFAKHEEAAQQYRTVSEYPDIGDLYYGVATGDVAQFGRVLDALARQITQQVKDAAAGIPPILLAGTTEVGDSIVDNQLDSLQQKIAKLGYALRLRYLSKQEGEQVPSLFDAWLVDRDFRNPQRQTLEVRVLLTRDQLSDLHAVLRRVLDAAEEGLISPRSFLDDLKSLAATISRDPSELGRTTRVTGARQANLADMGFMREYIEDLPYTGKLMNISLDDWLEWPAKRQIEFVQKLEEKINYYQALHDHTDLWVSPGGGPVSGDSVFPIALEMLP